MFVVWTMPLSVLDSKCLVSTPASKNRGLARRYHWVRFHRIYLHSALLFLTICSLLPNIPAHLLEQNGTSPSLLLEFELKNRCCFAFHRNSLLQTGQIIYLSWYLECLFWRSLKGTTSKLSGELFNGFPSLWWTCSYGSNGLPKISAISIRGYDIDFLTPSSSSIYALILPSLQTYVLISLTFNPLIAKVPCVCRFRHTRINSSEPPFTTVPNSNFWLPV